MLMLRLQGKEKRKRDGVVDINQRLDQASKEREDRNTKNGREDLDSNWKTESLDTFHDKKLVFEHAFRERTSIIERLGDISTPTTA